MLHRFLRGGHARSKGGGLQPSQPQKPQEGEQVNDRDNNSTEFSPFARLNDDCLTQILSYIDPVERFKIERVSTMWQRCAVQASTCQKHLMVNYQSNGLFGIRESETQLCRLISRNSSSLVSLDLSLVPSKVKKSAVETIGSCCRKLERLDISGAFVSNVGITSIVENCNRLKWLKVDGCSRIKEKGFWNIFKHCKQLESLLCNANRMSGNCFKIAPISLKEIDLRHCHLQSENGICFLSNRCSNLTTLNLNNCKLPSLAGLSDVFKNCPKLRDINIGHVFHDDVPVTQQEDLQANPIQSLCSPAVVTSLMIDNARLSDRDLQFLCQNCANLNELDISCNFLNDDSVSQLSTLVNLEVLHICHVFNITNSALTDLVTRGQLKCLRMQGCRKITDGLFELMAVSCTQMEELDIAGVVNASAKTLSAFSRSMDDQPSRNLKIYAYNNAFLDDENKWPECTPNVLVCVVYRRLYTSHDRWVLEGSEDPHNIVVNRWWDQDSSEEEEEEEDDDVIPSTLMSNLNLAAENENPPGMSMEKLRSTRNCSEASVMSNSGFVESSERAQEVASDESRQLENSSIVCVPADMVNDWDDAGYFADDNYDDQFLVNDDPLEQEYWDRS